jgi:hypothetical protein
VESADLIGYPIVNNTTDMYPIGFIDKHDLQHRLREYQEIIGIDVAFAVV